MKNVDIDLKDRNLYSYEEYRKLTEALSNAGRTTGEIQDESRISSTVLNESRMRRLDKKYTPSKAVEERISALREQQWIVITEAWCGDAAQNTPVINKIAAMNDKIDLKLLLRDENLDVMDQFLTNGGRSIPKLIALDKETKNVLFEWGPRPKEIQDTFIDLKDQGIEKDKIHPIIHKTYAKHKGSSLEEDLLEILS